MAPPPAEPKINLDPPGYSIYKDWKRVGTYLENATKKAGKVIQTEKEQAQKQEELKLDYKT